MVKENVLPLYLKEEELRKCFNYDDRTYPSLTAGCQSQIAKETSYWERDRFMGRAVRFAKGDTASMLQTLRQRVETGLQAKVEQSKANDARKKKRTIDQYVAKMDEEEQQAKQLRLAAETKRRKDYERACSMQEKATNDYHFENAAAEFESDRLRGYLDSEERAKQCHAEYTRLKEEKKQREEKAAAEENQRWKKKMIIGLIAVSLALLAIFTLLVRDYVIKNSIKNSRYNSAYNSAIELYNDGKYEEAAAAFKEIIPFKDSLHRSYSAAEKLYEEGKYKEAAEAFEALGYFGEERAREIWDEIKKSPD